MPLGSSFSSEPQRRVAPAPTQSQSSAHFGPDNSDLVVPHPKHRARTGGVKRHRPQILERTQLRIDAGASNSRGIAGNHEDLPVERPAALLPLLPAEPALDDVVAADPMGLERPLVIFRVRREKRRDVARFCGGPGVYVFLDPGPNLFLRCHVPAPLQAALKSSLHCRTDPRKAPRSWVWRT